MSIELQTIAHITTVIVLPVLAFAVRKIWAMDVRLVRVEEKLDAAKRKLER